MNWYTNTFSKGGLGARSPRSAFSVISAWIFLIVCQHAKETIYASPLRDFEVHAEDLQHNLYRMHPGERGIVYTLPYFFSAL